MHCILKMSNQDKENLDPIKCEACDILFSTRGNLLRHKRIKHGENNKVQHQAHQVSCCSCDNVIGSILQLRHHLVDEHDIGAASEQEHQVFNSVQGKLFFILF